MKYELTNSQVFVILAGLDALAEDCENENDATTDPEIIKSNNEKLVEVAELYEYIANHKEGMVPEE